MPGVDNVDSDDEELTTGPRERGLRTRVGRLRLDLLLGAVILLGIIVVGRAMAHDHGAASPRPTPAPSATAPIGGFGSGAPDSGSGLLNGGASFGSTFTFSPASSDVVIAPSGRELP